MKRTKREQNAIFIHISFYLVLFIGLLGFFIATILPKIILIEENKVIAKELYSDITRIEKQGVSFEEFKDVISSKNKDRVTSEILNNITIDFYNENLVNPENNLYTNFLKEKENILNNEENQKIVKENNEQIAKILPSYSEYDVELADNYLTDYKFVNYIESLIESFNLVTNTSIGISNLTLLKDFAVNEKKGEGLDSNIFYIPMKFSLKGSKYGIIQFLYFIENVGNISIDEKNIKLEDDASFLSRNGIDKVLESDKYSMNYNIFEHQITDIQTININEYLDSSYNDRGDLNFIDFILKTQGNESFQVDVSLMFYVKGQPAYKLEEYITNILNKHKTLNDLVTKQLKNTDLKVISRIKLTKFNDTIKQLSKEIQSIRKSLNKKEGLEGLYKRAVHIDEIITPILKNLQK